MYHSFGLKVQDGEEAINSLRSVIRCGVEKQLPFIHKLGEQDTKHFLIFCGKDIIVEQEIIFEALKEYKGLTHFVSQKSLDSAESAMVFQDFDTEISSEDTKKILKTFDSGKGASVFVANDTHYQNKLRADLVADVVQKMLEATPDSRKNKL